MIVGAVAIFVFIGLGLHGLIPKGTSLPPPPCHTQYTEWHGSIYNEILKLSDHTWEAPMMLSPMYPPRCAISPRRWRELMWDLSHKNKLSIKETTLLHKLEKK